MKEKLFFEPLDDWFFLYSLWLICFLTMAECYSLVGGLRIPCGRSTISYFIFVSRKGGLNVRMYPILIGLLRVCPCIFVVHNDKFIIGELTGVCPFYYVIIKDACPGLD